MSGRCVPPAYGSLRIQTSPGAGSCAIDGGDRVGHRAEVDGDVLGLRDHPAALVEERGRAVAPLLDVRRERGADEHGAHLLGDRAQALPMTWSSMFTVSSRLVTSVLDPSLTPTHPGGTSTVAPASSTTAGPATRRGCRPRELERRARAHVGRAHRDELERRARGRRSRSAPRARGGTPPRGRLRAAPSARRTGPRSAGRPRPRAAARRPRRAGRRSERTRVAPLVARDEPERREHARRRGHEHRADPELLGERARVQRPGAAERDEREVARIVAALDRDDAQRAQHLRVDDLDDGRGVERRRARARRPRGRARRPPASRVRQAAEQEVRVGHGRLRPAAAVAGRARVGARALAARRAARRPRRRQTIEPPPAPTVWMSTVGSRIGRPRDDALARALGRAADDQADVGRRAAHVERDRVLEARPARRRAPRRRRPPPARRRATSAGCAAASSSVATPPDERMTSGSGSPRLAAAARERAQVARRRPGRGRRRPRSSTRARTRGTPARPRARRRRARPAAAAAAPSATARSCVGSRKAKRRQTATASASSSRQRVEVERLELAVRAHPPAHAERSARAGRAARDAPRRAGRGARASGGAGAAGARSPRSSTNAVRAPLRSSSAFVATVVPCVKRSTPAAPTACAAATTDSSWRAAVGTFAVRSSPSSRRTASVNVPPTSTPRMLH